VLCFARALGEFGATALFAGNAAGVTRTMPLAIYTAFNGAGVEEDTAIALSLCSSSSPSRCSCWCAGGERGACDEGRCAHPSRRVRDVRGLRRAAG
jgi:hypothetical protein